MDAILHDWPYAGLGLAVVILAGVLFAPSQPGVPRFRDPPRLIWLAVALYLLHQFEEHGIDLLGRHYQFLSELCTTLGHAELDTCPADARFILAVNVPLVWLTGPLCAALARRRVFVGAMFLCTPLVNSFAHLVPALARGAYNPGLLTAVVLFIPLCAYTLPLLRKQGALDGPRLAAIPIAGVALHAVLLASLKATEAGLIGPGLRDTIQVFNAFMPLAAGFALEKAIGPKR